MNSYNPADLTDCTVQLGPDEVRVVHDYWDQVIREEDVPIGERVYCPPSLEELDERRSRRQARRGLASVTRLARAQRPAAGQMVSGQFSTGPEAA